MQITRDRGSLIEFSFVSRLDAAMPAEAVARLVRQVWRCNTAAGLTGLMAIRGREVREVVEGDVEAVLPLASRILSDPRHGRIRVLAFGPLLARRYSAWCVEGFAFPDAAAHCGAPIRDATVVDLQPRRREAGVECDARCNRALSS